MVGGAIVELTKALVHRSAATYWVKSTGQLPPGMKSLKTVEPAPEEPARKVKKRGSSAGAVAADENALLLRRQLAAVMHQEA